MLRTYKANQIAILLILLLILLAGCEFKDFRGKMRWLDYQAGELMEKLRQEKEDINKEEEQLPPVTADNLTQELKEKIDQWLKDNSLNRYGDAMDTMYTGGTPLFNEATGESLDRFDYILDKHPDILEKLD